MRVGCSGKALMECNPVLIYIAVLYTVNSM
jgi:hypothetical protein